MLKIDSLVAEAEAEWLRAVVASSAAAKGRPMMRAERLLGRAWKLNEANPELAPLDGGPWSSGRPEVQRATWSERDQIDEVRRLGPGTPGECAELGLLIAQRAQRQSSFPGIVREEQAASNPRPSGDIVQCSASGLRDSSGRLQRAFY